MEKDNSQVLDITNSSNYNKITEYIRQGGSK